MSRNRSLNLKYIGFKMFREETESNMLLEYIAEGNPVKVHEVLNYRAHLIHKTGKVNDVKYDITPLQFACLTKNKPIVRIILSYLPRLSMAEQEVVSQQLANMVTKVTSPADQEVFREISRSIQRDKCAANNGNKR